MRQGKIFEHEERYRELLKRQGELVDLLDITKNQAAAQQATESTGDLETVPVEASEMGISTDVEPSEGSPTPAVAVASIEPRPITRRFKARTPAKGQTTKLTSPTVRLVPQEPARMKIAV